MKKTELQKEFEEWYGNTMPTSRLPNLPKRPWSYVNNEGNYYWSDVSHGFKCWLAGKQSK